MKKIKQSLTICLLAACLIPMYGCGKSGGSGASAKGQNVVTISGDDQMKFDKKTIKVKAGQKVKLTLKHTGKMKAEVMGHNFVLLKKGTDASAFATKAVAAKDQQYIPPDMKDSVLAYTKVIGGGQSDTIEFVAPPAGSYPFLCSFPGHFAMMQGELVSE